MVNILKKLLIYLLKKLSIFHLDVGDGDFIGRKLDVTDKLKYIKKLNKNHEVHLHLMVNNLINHFTEILTSFHIMRNLVQIILEYTEEHLIV